MPNLNPRLSVVLPPKVMTTLGRLAALQRRSKSAVAREFLTEVEPVLARIVGMLELAATAEGQWPRKFVADLERIQGEMEGQALTAMGQLDAFGDRLAAQRPKRAGGALGHSAATTKRPRRKATPHD